MNMPRQFSAGQREGIEQRHPQVFRTDWRKRGVALALLATMLFLLAVAVANFELSPARLWTGIGRIGGFIGLMVPPWPGSPERARLYAKALAETVAIAFLGTLIAAVLALPAGFIAAKNVVASRVVHFLSRRSLDTIRSVDTLIWALIWVGVVGLGPFAGVLAIMTSDFGIFGKLFSEAIENLDRKPVEGVLSTGGSRLHAIRYAIAPQVLPVLVSQVLYFFESNTRSATIIGIVGAGGIGLHLSEQIRTLEWQATAFIVLMILLAVAVIDAVSARLRFAIIGKSAVPH